ncbi:hypothetical protein LUZ63_001759 [Rhynchospora breviuscula]|uniref:Uncharacterized protein n=1 Tax=Rhynchospora breviuscula TaxID=2022672 RepID=A0A9Q0CXJ0_9POAL|nr:hypothetical protein LUZ63_001759 [Rhynchospora breviuscula]
MDTPDPESSTTIEERFFVNVKGAMDSLQLFLHTSKKLALNLGQPFNRDSKPVRIDEDEFYKLKLRLDAIRATLQRSDGLGLSDEFDRLWMRELRDLEYRAEDVVETIQFEVLRATTRFEEFKNELLLASSGKRKREAYNLFPSVTSASVFLKIKKITDRFHEIARQRDALRLQEEDGNKLVKPSPIIPMSSHSACQLVGRKDDMDKLIEWLKSDELSHGTYSVKTIVGMAGVGKTTLVQHVYHDHAIQSSFDLKIWVHMSVQYDVVEVMRKIVEGIGKTSPYLSELDSLHHTAIHHFRDKKFLLVLDDMWDEDPRHWSSLQVPLTYGAKGSKLVVTTRSMKVSQIMCAKRYHLRCLSDDSSWELCRNRACQGRKIELDCNMKAIGKMIVSRCKGLPLAAEAVGVSLSFSHEEKHWNRILKNLLLTEDDEVSKILPALKVSYDLLPLHLKRCFAYCSLFPKGYVFQKDVLVKLWMAQGFIDCNGSSSLEEVGGKYFDYLLDRCFFLHPPFHYPTEERYVMHDLYHELAEDVSGKEFNRNEDSKMPKLDEKVRHSSIVPPEHLLKEAIQLGSFGGQDLRSFLFVGEKKLEGVPFRMNISRDLFVLLDCLRVLDLSNTDIENLPCNLGNLIHLRYLSFENSRVRCLPESIGGLFNLQTLNLRECIYLDELPKGLKLLDKLRHLYLPLYRSCRILMPYGIGQMTSLQTLSFFVMGTETESCRIEELSNLVNLKGEMHVLGINNVTDPKFAEEANMQNKLKVEKLTLEWSIADSTSPDLNGELASEVLEKLKPYHNLEELTLNGFCGTRLPSWLSDQVLLKLTTLDLKRCNKVEKLPSLGKLPSLKRLSVHSMVRLTRIGEEFCGHASSSSSMGWCHSAFPKLEALVFKNMDAWEEWGGVESTDFPCLKYLSLYECTLLRKFPQFPDSVKVKRNPKLKELAITKFQKTQIIILHGETSNNTPCNFLGDRDIIMLEAMQ